MLNQLLSKRRIPIVFCIDIEPDTRKLLRDARGDWLGFEKTFEFFEELRPRLAEVTRSPVHFSWFLRMDPQIAHNYGSHDWAVTRYRHLIKELENAGDEIGLHSHAWRWDEQRNDWLADFGDPEWIDHCIGSAFDAFHKSMHRECKSFRFGDHWLSERALDQLEELGMQYDLTLEPGQAIPMLQPKEAFTGSFPDCRTMPQSPYQPRKNDFTKAGWFAKRNLWILPVSADLPEGGGSPQPDEPYITLNLAFHGPTFASIMDRLLAKLSRPFIVIVARTDVTIVPEQRTYLLENIEYLISHPYAERFVYETPAEGIDRLRFSPLRGLKDRGPKLQGQVGSLKRGLMKSLRGEG